MKTRLLSLVLILALILPAVTACGTPAESGKDTGASPSPANTAEAGTADETETQSDYERCGLTEGLSYNGEDYIMLINANTTKYFDADEYTGEALNDAVFERNTAVETQLNVKIGVVEGSDWGSDSISKFQTDVHSGACTYHLLLAHTCAGGAPLLTNGFILDMSRLDNLNFDRPWWNSYIIETLNFNDKVFYCAGDLNLTSIANMWILMFSKPMTEILGKEDPYTLVDEGRWTLDAFHKQLGGITEDLNGDGKYTVDADRIALTGMSGLLDVFLYSCGGHAVVVGDGGPEIMLGDERSQNILEQFVANMVDTKWQLDAASDSAITGAFDDHRLYFIGERMGNITKYSDCEAAYGIVPYPKYDELQEEYYSLADAEGGILCMPVTLVGEDAERVAAVTQMLAMKTFDSVTPVYYDTMLKTRYARDAKTADMVDIIFRSLVYDFGYVYDNWVVGFQSAMWNLGKEADTGLQSYVATKKKLADKYFVKIYDAFFND